MAWHCFELRVRGLVACVALLYSCLAHSANDFLYTVQPGDHPWNIAQRFLKGTSYGQQLSRLNRIANDHRLQPGTQLRIPSEWLKLQSSRVRFLAVQGDAVVIAGAAGSRAAVEGETLPAGSSLRTGARSSTTLEFEDGSRVLVRQDTELRLVQSEQRVLSESRLFNLELLYGALENIVKPNRDPSARFEIRSPSAVAAVRGTQFRVSATSQQTWAEVLDGSVLVSNSAGQSTTGAGSGTFTEAGQAPGSPTLLLAAPDLLTLPERLERLPIDWPLPVVAGAVRYRTQAAPDQRFEVVSSDEVSAPARLRALNIADGDYVFRVRAIDANGLEGISAERMLSVQARPEPPLLIEPGPDAVTVSARPTFRWTQAANGRNYRLQVIPASEDPAVQVNEQMIAGTGSATAPVDLPAGLYRWRVAAVDSATGRQGPWGDSQSFRRVVPGPGVEPVQTAPGSLTLRWSAQPQTKTYKLQVSRESTFNPLLLDTETGAAQYGLERLVAGKYHIRVLSIGQDGYAGPWGEPQTFTVPQEAVPEHWKKLLLLLPLLWLLGLAWLRPAIHHRMRAGIHGGAYWSGKHRGWWVSL